ncbi:MAG: hypothetical protein IJ593_03120 [Lachnospiraceae bacterium]|nr:hypothetical protein [Lachnospiraceae bacterium]
MHKSLRLIKRVATIFFIAIISINTFAAVVGDNDGAAFITKAEFDSLKNDFQSQLDRYNSSIDNKIDGAIASYLAGIKMNSTLNAQANINELKFPLKIININKDLMDVDGLYNTTSTWVTPSFKTSIDFFMFESWSGALWIREGKGEWGKSVTALNVNVKDGKWVCDAEISDLTYALNGTLLWDNSGGSDYPNKHTYPILGMDWSKFVKEDAGNYWSSKQQRVRTNKVEIASDGTWYGYISDNNKTITMNLFPAAMDSNVVPDWSEGADLDYWPAFSGTMTTGRLSDYLTDMVSWSYNYQKSDIFDFIYNLDENHGTTIDKTNLALVTYGSDHKLYLANMKRFRQSINLETPVAQAWRDRTLRTKDPTNTTYFSGTLRTVSPGYTPISNWHSLSGVDHDAETKSSIPPSYLYYDITDNSGNAIARHHMIDGIPVLRIDPVISSGSVNEINIEFNLTSSGSTSGSKYIAFSTAPITVQGDGMPNVASIKSDDKILAISSSSSGSTPVANSDSKLWTVKSGSNSFKISGISLNRNDIIYLKIYFDKSEGYVEMSKPEFTLTID